MKSPPLYFDEIYYLDRHKGRLQTALHELKYQKCLAFAHELASEWNQLAADGLKNTRAHYLVPVPLSKEKHCARGFNQSRELARRLRCNAQVEKWPYALL